MTAPPADQTTPPTPPTGNPPAGETPTLSVTVVTASLGAAVWVVYFATLIAVYLVAYHRKVMPCQAAAGWGLAIAFAAALLVVLFAVGWPSTARGASGPASRALAGLAGALLALASVAVIWVAINLTIARDPAGAWMLTIGAVAGPVAVLLSRVALPPRAGIAASDTAVEPLVIPARELELARPANGTVTDVEAPHEAAAMEVAAPESAEMAVTEVAVSEVAVSEVAVSEVAVSEVAVSEVATLEADGPAVVLDEAVEATLMSDAAMAEMETLVRAPQLLVNPLLTADWEDRLGGSPPRVAVDKGMWDEVLDALGTRRMEVGGVALTVRVPGTLIVLGLVLPKQVHVSGVFCEFRAEEVGRVRDVIDRSSEILQLDSAQVKIAWVHTHPGIGPFLSGTDQATTATWRAFDPEFTPIVLDPLAQRISQQIGVFDTNNRKIQNLRVIEGLADRHAVGLLRDELVDAYRDAKGTMVLFGAF
jgi:hypothetical protein